ncbi:hypothetical protein [Pandoraea sputorum]|nr:hypothetical protein [Pandoraea sputorum]
MHERLKKQLESVARYRASGRDLQGLSRLQMGVNAGPIVAKRAAALRLAR